MSYNIIILFDIPQLHCPIPSDQLSLLRLLSSEANQVFTYYPSSKSELSFVGANGETLKADSEHVTTDKVSELYC